MMIIRHDEHDRTAHRQYYREKRSRRVSCRHDEKLDASRGYTIISRLWRPTMNIANAGRFRLYRHAIYERASAFSATRRQA